jgi:formylglycine-generating enzyme required for sulfatase activity
MADVFFSYKREDRSSVEPLVRLLESEDLTVWWDSSLVAGERFEEVIGREIEEANCVIVAWSVSSVNALWVRAEAAAGRDRGILVPVILDGVQPPLSFRQFQTPDLSNWTGDVNDPRIRQLIAGVLRVVRNASDSGDDTTATPGKAMRDDPATRAVEPGRTATVAYATKPARTEIASPIHMGRRRLLQIGATAGAVGLASAAGLWLGLPVLSRRSWPAARMETFDLITVDERGLINPSQTQSVGVFEVTFGGKSMEFSVIPHGDFLIGSPDNEPERRPNEGPQQLVQLRRFAISRTAVTQAEWAAVVKAVPGPITHTLDPYPSFFRGDDLPVETVSWYEATEFCQRLSAVTGLSMRLPSEAEWEYACRAGTKSAFNFGPTVTPELANYCGTGGAVCGMNQGVDISSQTYDGIAYPNGFYASGPAGVFKGRTTNVRSYPPNGFGLYEMHGNVWEHCFDAGPVDYRQVPMDGSPYREQMEVRILRGGSWSHNPAICRSAYRDSMRSAHAGWQGRVGLRVVCEPGDGDRTE